MVEGIEFIKLSKRCTNLSKFCTGKPIIKQSPLQGTHVLEDLIKLRDMAWAALDLPVCPDEGAGHKDLFPAAKPLKRPRLSLGQAPRVITLCAPPIPGDASCAEAVCIRTLVEKDTKHLWVELNETNLVYVRKAIQAALSEEDLHVQRRRPKDELVTSSQAGVRWDYRRSCWYVRYKDEDGKQRYREFKVDGVVGSDEHVLNRAEVEVVATAFFNAHCAPQAA